MYLLHRPSGKAAYIARRGGWGWEALQDAAERMAALFNEVEAVGTNQDDFSVALEDSSKARMATDLKRARRFSEIEPREKPAPIAEDGA